MNNSHSSVLPAAPGALFFIVRVATELASTVLALQGNRFEEAKLLQLDILFSMCFCHKFQWFTAF